MKPKTLIISTGDTHIYLNHVTQVNEQLSRSPFPFPKILLDDSIIDKSFEEITIDDFTLTDYISHPSIKAPMAV
jgi:thymidylate synthase